MKTSSKDYIPFKLWIRLIENPNGKGYLVGIHETDEIEMTIVHKNQDYHTAKRFMVDSYIKNSSLQKYFRMIHWEHDKEAFVLAYEPKQETPIFIPEGIP